MRNYLCFVFLTIPAGNIFADISIQGLPPVSDFVYTFMESPNTNRVRNSLVKNGAFFLNTQYGYIEHPLVEIDDDGNRENIVDSLHTIDFRSGVVLNQRLNVSLNLSFNSIKLRTEDSSIALGDSVLQAKYRLSDDNDKYQYALVPEIYLPIGAQEKFLSANKFGAAIRGAISRQFGIFGVNANIGYRHIPDHTWRILDYSNQAILGIGLEAKVTEKLSAVAEGISFLSIPYDSLNSLGEFYTGAVWEFYPYTALSGGVSTTGFDEDNNDSFRIVLGLKHFFGMEEESGPRGPLCTIEPFNVTYHSRPLTSEEEKVFNEKLPYLSNVKVKSKSGETSIKTLGFGEMTGTTENGLGYIENAQIPFAIDINDLPEVSSIKNIYYARLKLAINKYSSDKFIGTEILCSVDFKVCSGKPIALKHWEKALNKEYFPKPGKAHNEKFSHLYLDRSLGKIGKKDFYSGQVTLSLSDLLSGSQFDVKKLFNRGREQKTLFFVVADDTLPLNDTQLDLSLGVERCRD